MMKITLLLIGKSSFAYVKEGMQIYTKRLSYYVPFNVVEIPDLKGAASLSEEQIKIKEGSLILKSLKPQDYLYLLDERGESLTSVKWAEKLERQMVMNPGKDIVFVVGGAYGFSKEVYDRANGMLSLSKMTFSHQIIRIIFLEQLYRAFTIMKGEPYHHQ